MNCTERWWWPLQDAGADLIVFETFTDLYDMKAAVLAAKEHTHLPILATMSFEGNGRTFTGTTVPAMAMTLEGLGVDAVGFNCSLGPAEILSLAEELRQWTDLPLVVKPNAGLPDPQTNEYTITAAEFAREMVPFTQLGVRILGGCCGTSPAFIQELRHAIGHPAAGSDPSRQAPRVCSASQVAELTGVRVVGERINPTGKKRFQQALREPRSGLYPEPSHGSAGRRRGHFGRERRSAWHRRGGHDDRCGQGHPVGGLPAPAN